MPSPVRFGVKRVGAADVEDGFAANPEPLLKEGEQTFQIGEEEVPDFIETCVQVTNVLFDNCDSFLMWQI